MLVLAGTIVYTGPTCPTTAGGPLNVALDVTLPTAVPSGDYDVKISAVDAAKANFYCLDAKFTL